MNFSELLYATGKCLHVHRSSSIFISLCLLFKIFRLTLSYWKLLNPEKLYNIKRYIAIS